MRAARLRAGMSAAELAQKVGYSTAWIYRIETGRVMPSVRVLDALSGALSLSPWESRYLFALAHRVGDQNQELIEAPHQQLLDALHPNPAAWLDASWTIDIANAEFRRLFKGFWATPNLIYWHYASVAARDIIVNWEETSQWCVGWLRFGLATGTPGVMEMVDAMMPGRVFRAQWNAQVIPIDPATRPWIIRDLDDGRLLTLDMWALRPAGPAAGLLLLGVITDT